MDQYYLSKTIYYSLLASEARNDFAKMILASTADYWWRLYITTPVKYWTETRLLNSARK